MRRTTGIMDSYVMIVTARSNSDLKPQEWDRQKAMIKSVMNWDQATSTWWARPSSSHPEHVAHVLNTLFEAARVYGTAVTRGRCQHDRPMPGDPL